MTDLTERLAAKLATVQEPWGFAWESDSPEGQTYAELVADYAPTILPLLLSEPELVAGLAPEVKREVLAVLLRERLGAVVNWDGDVRFERYGNAVLLHREEVLKAPAPEATNDG